MTIYPFTAEHFHVDKAKQDHSCPYYTVDEASLAVHMAGQYELGELSSIRETLAEANRLFKHRCWVEIQESEDFAENKWWRVVKWRDGEAHPHGWLSMKGLAYRQLEELCQSGHAADFGWLKE